MLQSWSANAGWLFLWGTGESWALINFLECEFFFFSLPLAWRSNFPHTLAWCGRFSLCYSISLILSAWGTATNARGMVGSLRSPGSYFRNAVRLNSKGQQCFSRDPSGGSERSRLPWERIDFRDIWCYNGGVGIFQFQSTHSGWERLS